MILMYYSLFDHSLVTGHLGYFQVLAFTNKIAIKCMDRFLCEHKFSFLQDKCPRVQLLGHVVVACLFFFK